MSSKTYALLERGTCPLETTFVDEEGRPSFTMFVSPSPLSSSTYPICSSSYRDPNLLIRVAREKEWSQQHASDVKGAASAFVYLDHVAQPVHIAFGNGERQPTAEWMRPARKDENVRAFTSQSIGQFGGEYKWRARSSDKFEVCHLVHLSLWT
jgi:hypothetical protein